MASWGNEPVLFVIPRSEGDEESGLSERREEPRSLASLGMTTLLNVCLSTGCDVCDGYESNRAAALLPIRFDGQLTIS